LPGDNGAFFLAHNVGLIAQILLGMSQEELAMFDVTRCKHEFSLKGIVKARTALKR
jgi:hypothetical protein